MIILISYSTFAKKNEEQWVGWVTAAGSILIGVGFGLLLMKYQTFGGFCLAAWGGFSTSLLIYNAFLYKIKSEIVLWSFAAALGILYVVLLIFFFDHILIHATAMIGSFIFVYGVGLVAGHYTNPFLIVQYIKRGQIDSIDPLFYAYLGGNLVLYIMGCVWQYSRLRLAEDLK